MGVGGDENCLRGQIMDCWVIDEVDKQRECERKRERDRQRERGQRQERRKSPGRDEEQKTSDFGGDTATWKH